MPDQQAGPRTARSAALLPWREVFLRPGVKVDATDLPPLFEGKGCSHFPPLRLPPESLVVVDQVG